MNEKSGEVYFQILTLVVSIFAFSFIIAGLSLGIERVSAQTTIPSSLSTSQEVKCCTNSKNGSSCQEFYSGSDCEKNCLGACNSGSCSQRAECKLGCCFDKEEGVCAPQSAKERCENQTNGQWSQDSYCNINQCQKGCCKLGLQNQFITEQRCKKLAGLYGTNFSFNKGVKDELSCIEKSSQDDRGACVYGEANKDGKRNCKATTQTECKSNIKGEFHKGDLCSKTSLNTVCERQKSTNCVEGNDGVYWFDSCGNMENIYSSDKDSSWAGGKILDKSKSCNSDSANTKSSTCGNCNYEKGSICGTYRIGTDTKPKYGDYVCKDLNCKNAPGQAGIKKNRINGESWCVYDGQIGEAGISSLTSILGIDTSILGNKGLLSSDVVGSRHFRYLCVNGEVNVEPCADYRKEICVDKGSVNGKNNAICRVNMWESCVGLNSETGCGTACMAQCKINPDCRVQNVEVDKNFKFNACVPKYPPGFDLAGLGGITSLLSGSSGTVGDLAGGLGSLANNQLLGSLSDGISSLNTCGMASQTCTVTYIKKCPGGWKCVDNCNCMTMDFTSQLNNLCVSAGDCGAYVNIAGAVTDQGYSVSKKGDKGHAPPRLTEISKLYSIFALPIPGQKASPGFFDNIQAINSLGLFGIGDIFGDGYAKTSGKVSDGLFGDSQLGSTVGIGLGVGGAVGVSTGFIGGSTVGGILGGSGFAVGTAFLWAAVAIAVVVGLMSAFGCGKMKKVTITFECKQWQRPTLGDCSFCGKDPLKPCTKYRCESLGLNCRLINENTGQDQCILDDKAIPIPIISPLDEALDKNLFKYTDISDNGFKIRALDGSCLDAFTPLAFGVKTSEFAQCKISENKDSFENMSEYFLESSLYTKNHTMLTYPPSAESIAASELGDTESLGMVDEETMSSILSAVGDVNLYVKCANTNGNANDADYKINLCVKPGPDRNPPVILAVSPPENTTLAFDAKEQNVSVYVNEPSDCKWDLSSAADYNSMKNNMNCVTDVEEGTLLGWPCSTINPVPLESMSTTVYFLCRDQPWLKENNSRNVGNIYTYSLKKSENTLVILATSPNGTMIVGSEPTTIELAVETSGGISSGLASCGYNSIEPDNYIPMFETNSNIHKQTQTLNNGNYTYYFKCLDAAGNIALGNSSFGIELDKTIPEVSRVYYDAGNLVVLTTKDSECAYSYNQSDCNINFENATKMESDLTKEHSIQWNPAETHYIVCRDIWGNKPAGCSLIVKADELLKTK